MAIPIRSTGSVVTAPQYIRGLASPYFSRQRLEPLKAGGLTVDALVKVRQMFDIRLELDARHVP